MTTILKNLLICLIIGFVVISCKNVELGQQVNFTDQSYGCGNYLVYKLTSDMKTSIVVNGVAKSSREISYDISANLALSDSIQIVITRFDRKVDNYYCTFGEVEPVILDQWFAKEGNVTINFTPTGQANDYKVNIVLSDMKFYNSGNDLITISYLDFKDIVISF